MVLKRLTKSDFNKWRGKKEIPTVNENEMILKFWDFSCSPDDITRALDLKPYSTGIKGEAYLKGNIKRHLVSCHA